MGRLLPAALLLATAAVSAATPPPLSIDIWPRKQVTLTRGAVRLRIAAEPDERNRRLEWAIDSDRYSSASSRQLDGASSPRTVTMLLKDLPPGHYTFVVVLTRIDGEQRIADSFDLIAESPEEP